MREYRRVDLREQVSLVSQDVVLFNDSVAANVALGLTLIYGVLHIINFAHGAALMVALYGVYLLKEHWGVDPYAALLVVVPAMFALGYALQRGIINRASHGKDENILLVTLGLSIVLENLALGAYTRARARRYHSPGATSLGMTPARRRCGTRESYSSAKVLLMALRPTML